MSIGWMRPRAKRSGSRKEDRTIRQEIADEAHEAGGQNASGRCEALIASEAFAQCGVADQRKADCGDRQSQEPAGDRLEQESGQHQGKTRPRRNDECSDCHHSGTQCDRGPLRPGGIEQFASR
jgi:hypothetical protein